MFMVRKTYLLGKISAICLSLLLLSAFSFAQGSADFDKPVGTYQIKPGDKLSIKFFNHPELSEADLMIRPDGFISMQMIGDIKVDGLTAAQLKNKLEKDYVEILLNPIISINITDFVPPAIYIGGQIGRPGKYSLRDGNSIIKVIFMAGGFTENANRKMVLFARGGADGKWQINKVNVLDLIKKSPDERDITLSDGDYIFVPDSKLSKFTKVLESFQSVFPILSLF